jgi:hypothetical protein
LKPPLQLAIYGDGETVVMSTGPLVLHGGLASGAANVGAASNRLKTVTPSTNVDRLIERRIDSMDNMAESSLMQLQIALPSQRGRPFASRCQTLHPVR